MGGDCRYYAQKRLGKKSDDLLTNMYEENDDSGKSDRDRGAWHFILFEYSAKDRLVTYHSVSPSLFLLRKWVLGDEALFCFYK